jgi:hypothetical protein
MRLHIKENSDEQVQILSGNDTTGQSQEYSGQQVSENRDRNNIDKDYYMDSNIESTVSNQGKHCSEKYKSCILIGSTATVLLGTLCLPVVAIPATALVSIYTGYQIYQQYKNENQADENQAANQNQLLINQNNRNFMSWYPKFVDIQAITHKNNPWLNLNIRLGISIAAGVLAAIVWAPPILSTIAAVALIGSQIYIHRNKVDENGVVNKTFSAKVVAGSIAAGVLAAIVWSPPILSAIAAAAALVTLAYHMTTTPANNSYCDIHVSPLGYAVSKLGYSVENVVDKLITQLEHCQVDNDNMREIKEAVKRELSGAVDIIKNAGNEISNSWSECFGKKNESEKRQSQPELIISTKF